MQRCVKKRVGTIPAEPIVALTHVTTHTSKSCLIPLAEVCYNCHRKLWGRLYGFLANEKGVVA